MFTAFVVLSGLGLLVLVHELGHAAVARALGLEVTDLSLGLGPSLASRTFRGVTFHLGPIPFGGYVRVRELAPAGDEGEGDLRRFAPAAVLARLAAIGAGSGANFLVAALAVAAAGLLLGLPTGRVLGLEVTAAPAGGSAGLWPGDLIVRAAGRPVRRVDELSRVFAEGQGERTTLTIRRGEELLELPVTPRRRGERWGLGARYVERPELRRASFGEALIQGLAYPPREAATLLGRWASLAQPGGEPRPVSAVGLADRVSRTGRWDLRRALGFAALLSLVVGLFNLIPFPCLDGGRLVLELVEASRGRRLAGRAAVALQVAGAALLLVSWALLVVGDLLRLR